MMGMSACLASQIPRCAAGFGFDDPGPAARVLFELFPGGEVAQEHQHGGVGHEAQPGLVADHAAFRASRCRLMRLWRPGRQDCAGCHAQRGLRRFSGSHALWGLADQGWCRARPAQPG